MKLKTKTAKQLEKEGVYVSSYANELIGKLDKNTEDVEMKVVTVKELGFTEPATWLEILKAGEKQGLLPCAHLRPNFPFGSLEIGDWLWIAMEPITVSDGHPSVFNVKRFSDGEQWLYTSWVRPDAQRYLGRRIVFKVVSQPSELGTLPSALGNSESLTLRVEKLEEILAYHNLDLPVEKE